MSKRTASMYDEGHEEVTEHAQDDLDEILDEYDEEIEAACNGVEDITEFDDDEVAKGGAGGFTYRDGPRIGPVTCPIVIDPSEDGMSVDPADFESVVPGYSASYKGSSKGSRRWFFTLNTPSKAEEDAICMFLQEKCVWAILGREHVSRSHLQGAFRMKDAKTMSALKKLPCFAACYLSVARGTEAHCKSYCSKEGNFLEFHPENFSAGQGSRTDIHQAVAMVRDNGEAGLEELIQADPMTFVKFHAGLEKLVIRHQKPRRLVAPPEVVWYMGESNSGKTYQAIRQAEAAAQTLGSEVYEANIGNHPWYPGLKTQKVMLINEFRATNSRRQHIPMDTWCKMWDVLGYNAEIKGANVELQCEKFYVTCVHHPNEIYVDSVEEPNVQFLRRITKVIKCVRQETPSGPVFTQEDLGAGTAQYPIFNMP